MENDAQLARLRWHCRRGMLELDLLLLPFLEKVFPTLTSHDQATFTELLLCHDQDLYAWLISYQTPDNNEFAAMVEQIRKYAQTGSD